MVEWPDGPRLFEHLRDLPEPLRVADVPGYLGSLGLSVSPWGSRTLQGTPMHHRGEHLGNFFLGDREDGEAFTAKDEEILVLFASQAATAIANARTHRDVERARADLEALVETSPVGVVVFDSGTGRAVSEDGTLVPVFERPRAEASERCCLITTAASRQRPEVRTFREWILNEGGGRGPHRTRPRPAPAVTRLRLPFSPPAPRALSRNTGGFLSRTRAGGNADRADEAWMSLAYFRGLPSKEDSSFAYAPDARAHRYAGSERCMDRYVAGVHSHTSTGTNVLTHGRLEPSIAVCRYGKPYGLSSQWRKRWPLLSHGRRTHDLAGWSE